MDETTKECGMEIAAVLEKYGATIEVGFDATNHFAIRIETPTDEIEMETDEPIMTPKDLFDKVLA